MQVQRAAHGLRKVKERELIRCLGSEQRTMYEKEAVGMITILRPLSFAFTTPWV